MLGNSLLLGAEDAYTISRSVRLRSSASASLNRTFSTPTDAKKQTLSLWMKRGILSSSTQRIADGYNGTAANSTVLYPVAGDGLQFDFGGSAANSLSTTQVFRDPAAWYHIVLAIDTTQATASNRVLMYVNGVQVTSFSTATYPALNATSQLFGSGANNRIGSSWGGGSNYFDGYLTEINFIDGQALTPSSFGQTNTTTGVWSPKKYGGTYGANGFYLNFSDNSAATAAAIGKDYSGNGNNWTPNNISVTAGSTYDSMIDTPTAYADGNSGRGNYAVLNPLTAKSGYASTTDGNLRANFTSGANASFVLGNTFQSSGKWYCEAQIVSTGADATRPCVGIAKSSFDWNSISINLGDTSDSWAYQKNGQKRTASTSSAYGSSYTAGDIIGIALDMDAGTVTFYKNNVSQGTAFSSLSGDIALAISGYADGATRAVDVNFGQRPFTYTPPTGFKALNTQNLPDPTIKLPNKWFDATTYTGTGTTQSIVNSGSFAPDLVWTKARSNVQSNGLYDTVRGVTKAVYSDLTNAEATDVAGVTAFNANGFTAEGSNNTNANGWTYVGWQWKEGATAGLDIVTYTGNGTAGRTIAHSLGVAPSLIIAKCRSSAATNWPVFGTLLGANKYLLLNSTAASATGAPGYDNGTLATSSVFSVGNQTDINSNTATYVAYLFSEVQGFSKFGSYTGNGNADGPFVFCGVRPKWVMIKRTDTTADWEVLDTSRDSYNGMGALLNPNLSNAEAVSGPFIDVVSNGFKLRSTNAFFNASSGTYIFAAFAENPFKNSLAR